MPSIQEDLRAKLGAHTPLTNLVADRIYPGQVPDDDDPTPWLFYTVPTTEPIDQLDTLTGTTVLSEVEFHALADTYAEAKSIIDAVIEVLNNYNGTVIRQAHWLGSSEDATEEGYHHATRFRVWWRLS